MAASSAADLTSTHTNCSSSSKASSTNGPESAGRKSNGVVERMHRSLLDQHFRVEGRRTWFETIEEMQTVLDAYVVGYNTRRPH